MIGFAQTASVSILDDKLVVESAKYGRSVMADDEGYGDEGYTVIGMDHYTAEEGHPVGWTVLSFFLGSLVGAGIVLLLAPQSGRRTRQQIKEASLGAKVKAEKYYGQTREKVESAVERGKDFVSEKRPLLNAAFEAGKTAYEKEKEQRTKERKE
jgi:gas vesicle protein